MSEGNGELRFAGEPFILGGVTFTVPPLALGALKALLPRLKTLNLDGGAAEPADMDLVIDIAFAALRRNYPAMTRDEVGELLDLGNCSAFLNVIMGQSGLSRANPPMAVPSLVMSDGR